MQTKRFLATVLALGAIGCSDPVAPGRAPDLAVSRPEIDRPPAGRPFIVTLEPRANPVEVARDHGITPRFVYTYVLNGFAGSMSEVARSGLLRDARVVRVEPDHAVLSDGSGSEAAPPWGLDRIDQRSATLDNVYTFRATGRGVTAYIVDTGIRYGHSDFGGRASFGFDAFGSDGADCQGHGTHVAGTVGGRLYGVAKEVSLVSVRVLGCDGGGTVSTVVAGLNWIVANASLPAVANMSLGGGGSSTLDDAVRAAVAAGVSVSVSAGNFAADACYYSPARVKEALTVGATDPTDNRASFSNYGSCVDWYAPGVSILSAGLANDTASVLKSGTSMASPHTAGAAALYLEQNRTATPDQVATALASWLTKRVVPSGGKNDDLLYTGGLGDGSTGNLAPAAAFGVTCAGLTCAFSDQSSDSDGSIASWAWDFGGQGTSTAQNPSYSFAVGGTYRVTLTVKDNAGATSSTSKDITVSAPDQPAGNVVPVAGFTVACTDLACTFTDASTDSDGTITAWQWTFGDQATSGTQNPAHAYPAAGTYHVTLVVTDNAGGSTSTSRDLIVTAPVNLPPSAAFTPSCAGLACQFTDASQDPDGTIRSWVWSFGDGASSSFQSASPGPSHTFASGAVYRVSLTVTDNAGAQSTTLKDVAVGPVLTVTASKLKGKTTLNLKWTGVQSSKVDVYVNQSFIGAVDNTGATTYLAPDRGQTTYLVRICEAGTTLCSLGQTVQP